MNETTLSADLQEQINLKAEHEAALHFHPEYSRDANTACQICYRNGAKEYVVNYYQAKQLLEKFISRHEAGLLPDMHIYNEIKSFLDGSK